jgi:hypothetical protein
MLEVSACRDCVGMHVVSVRAQVWRCRKDRCKCSPVPSVRKCALRDVSVRVRHDDGSAAAGASRRRHAALTAAQRGRRRAHRRRCRTARVGVSVNACMRIQCTL